MSTSPYTHEALAEDIAALYESAMRCIPEGEPEARCLDHLFEALAVLASIVGEHLGPHAREVLGSSAP